MRQGLLVQAARKAGQNLTAGTFVRTAAGRFGSRLPAR